MYPPFASHLIAGLREAKSSVSDKNPIELSTQYPPYPRPIAERIAPGLQHGTGGNRATADDEGTVTAELGHQFRQTRHARALTRDSEMRSRPRWTPPPAPRRISLPTRVLETPVAEERVHRRLAANVVGVVVAGLDAVKMARLTGAVPQNVNFAVSEGVARAFLDGQDVPYETARSSKPIPTADIAAKAKKFTL